MKSDASEVCEIDNLKNENAILNLQVTILTHRLSTIEEEKQKALETYLFSRTVWAFEFPLSW